VRTLAKLQATILGLILLMGLGCRKGPTIGPDTAAVVNQAQIKNSDVEKVYQNRIKTAGQALSLEEASTLRLNILSQLINDEILMQRAAKDNLTAAEAEVTSKFADFKKDYTEEKFQQFLKDQGITTDDLRRELAKNATIEKLYNKEITSKITVSESEISEYFNKNKQSYNLPESWHVQHILVTPFPDQQLNNTKGDDAKTDEEAKQKVQSLLRKILGGEDFGIVARDFSEDPTSAPNGGDLRLLSAQQLEGIDTRFRQVVQSLRVGETFPSPVPTKYGYHIIKLLEKERGGQHDLTDPKVQADIRQIVFNRKETLLKTAYLEVVRNGATVQNFLAQKILDEIGKAFRPAGSK
jgi:peptidyl-prolyl cis-trans isomerase SurA